MKHELKMNIRSGFYFLGTKNFHDTLVFRQNPVGGGFLRFRLESSREPSPPAANSPARVKSGSERSRLSQALACPSIP
jgi:hypothetical protein